MATGYVLLHSSGKAFGSKCEVIVDDIRRYLIDRGHTDFFVRAGYHAVSGLWRVVVAILHCKKQVRLFCDSCNYLQGYLGMFPTRIPRLSIAEVRRKAEFGFFDHEWCGSTFSVCLNGQSGFVAYNGFRDGGEMRSGWSTLCWSELE